MEHGEIRFAMYGLGQGWRQGQEADVAAIVGVGDGVASNQGIGRRMGGVTCFKK